MKSWHSFFAPHHISHLHAKRFTSPSISTYSWDSSKTITQLLCTNETFGYIGVDLVDHIDFRSSECAFVYPQRLGVRHCSKTDLVCTNGYRLSTKFAPKVAAHFDHYFRLLSEKRAQIDWENLHVTHYRRGDKVETCTHQNLWNCQNMSTFIRHIRALHPHKPIYVATNEEDKHQMKILSEAKAYNVFGRQILEDIGKS